MLQLNGSELENGSFTSNIDKDGIAGFDVMLSSPVTVEESIIVTISATISGSESCYGENGIAKAESGALAVTFHDYLINELTIIEMTNGLVQGASFMKYTFQVQNLEIIYNFVSINICTLCQYQSNEYV
jgi:hypothetical protein